MTNVAQSRRRRLAHYMNPGSNTLVPGDEVDVEDSKTELFGKDADKILQDKEKATQLERMQSGRNARRRPALPLKIQLTSPPKAKITWLSWWKRRDEKFNKYRRKNSFLFVNLEWMRPTFPIFVHM